MPNVLERILKTAILLTLWSDVTGVSITQDIIFSNNKSELAIHPNSVDRNYVNKEEYNARAKSSALTRHLSTFDSLDRSHQPRSYYGGVPAPPYLPAFDPISVLACLAFLAFLLQSFAALFDRTRSIIPTIISSRRSSSEYGERFAETERRVLRALEEYASLSSDLLDNEKENENPVT